MIQLRERVFAALLGLAGIPAGLLAISVSSGSIAVHGDVLTFQPGLFTSPSYALPNASMTYSSSGPAPSGTSHITIHAGGVAYDLASLTTLIPMAAFGSGNGAYLEGVKDIPAAQVRVTVHYEISNNPQDNSPADTMKLRLSFENYGSSPVALGARIEIDTMVNGVDGANISVDNGFSVVSNNTVFSQAGGGIPGNWWAYDIPPPTPANLVSRGSLWGNPFGEAATMPDAFEVAEWSNTSGSGAWTPAGPGPVFDSSVVLWWTGSGGTGGPTQTLAPGASSKFVTYYGLNSGVLLSTFTPTPLPGPPLSPTATPTAGPPTPVQSPSPTPSITLTFSASPSFSITPTFSVSPVDTATPTLTPSPSITPTFSASPSFSPSPSITPTFSISPTPIQQSGPVELRQAYPNPFSERAYLVVVSKSGATATLMAYNVAGELVYSEDRALSTGVNIWDWDGRNSSGSRLASGAYLLRVGLKDSHETPSYLFIAVTR